MLYTTADKADAVILAELQEISLAVTSFSWLDGVPQVTTSAPLTPAEAADVLGYFQRQDNLTISGT